CGLDSIVRNDEGDTLIDVVIGGLGMEQFDLTKAMTIRIGISIAIQAGFGL
ncbi:hypothetical protein TorRG33x02_239340, partial [Trema orientale]